MYIFSNCLYDIIVNVHEIGSQIATQAISGTSFDHLARVNVTSVLLNQKL